LAGFARVLSGSLLSPAPSHHRHTHQSRSFYEYGW
jgi:hypothetical protein